MQTVQNEELKLGDQLAIDRTAMASDRTLMAWTRTSISMISFGFTIYKILEGMGKEGLSFTKNPMGPRQLGLFLIAIGTVSLGMGMVEHWHTKKGLGKKTSFKILSPTFLTSGAILLLGTFLFFSIIMQMELF
jgi:putative membrane protein